MGKGRAVTFTLVIYILLTIMAVLLWNACRVGFFVIAGLFAVYGFVRFMFDLTKLLSVTAEQDAETDARIQAKFDARAEKRETKRYYRDEAQMQKLVARNGRHSEGWPV